jgi:hypothetical protein
MAEVDLGKIKGVADMTRAANPNTEHAHATSKPPYMGAAAKGRPTAAMALV